MEVVLLSCLGELSICCAQRRQLIAAVKAPSLPSTRQCQHHLQTVPGAGPEHGQCGNYSYLGVLRYP